MRTKIITAASVCIIFVCIAVVLFYGQQKKEIPSTVNTKATASLLRDAKVLWEQRIKKEGAEKAYSAFLIEAPQSTIAPHEQAHAFGEALYDVKGLKGLAVCDSSFEFGCYHSFFGVAVQEEGIDVISQFDDACRAKYGNLNLPCEHGIGHGVLVYTDYENIVDALELCETVSTHPTGGCSSGVFMEYNFHTMDESTDGAYVRDQKDNLYAPCNGLPERFQPACYQEQVQWWQSLFNSDFAHIGELCNTLPYQSANYTTCFNGIGNYVAAFAKLEYEGIVEQCALMPNEETKGLCHEGASWLIRYEKDKADDAQMLCDVLAEPFRTSCSEKLQ